MSLATVHRRKSGGHYARVMGTLHRSLKAEKAGDAALGMMVRIWSYCADVGRHELTERDMAVIMVRDKNGPRKLKALLEAGLLDRTEGGYTPHDWFDHNPGIAPSESAPREADVSRTRREREEYVRDGEENATGNVTRNVTRNVSNTPEQNQVVAGSLSRPRTQDPGDKREREGERAGAPPPPTPIEPMPFAVPGAWTADRPGVVFRALFAERYQTEPSMAGKNLAGFHATVASTARMQGRDPEELFREKLSAWLMRPRRQAEASAPFACFVQAWGEITMPQDAVQPEAPRGGVSLEDQIQAADKALREAGVRGAPAGELQPLADRLRKLKTQRDERDDQARRYARR